MVRAIGCVDTRLHFETYRSYTRRTSDGVNSSTGHQACGPLDIPN